MNYKTRSSSWLRPNAHINPTLVHDHSTSTSVIAYQNRLNMKNRQTKKNKKENLTKLQVRSVLGAGNPTGWSHIGVSDAEHPKPWYQFWVRKRRRLQDLAAKDVQTDLELQQVAKAMIIKTKETLNFASSSIPKQDNRRDKGTAKMKSWQEERRVISFRENIQLRHHSIFRCHQWNFPDGSRVRARNRIRSASTQNS